MINYRRIKRASISHIGEFVYGATDGTITTFAVVTGAEGGGLSSKSALILGFANLFADGFSMGVSSYLGSRSEAKREPIHRSIVRSFVTFVAFIILGAVPLSVYVLRELFNLEITNVFGFSIGLALISFIVIGGIKSKVTKRSLPQSLLETIALGGIAATIAYSVGNILERII